MMRASLHSGKFPNGRGRSESGQALVEFSLVIIFLFVMTLAFIEMVLMMHTYSVLADAAKEGVRYAIVHGSGNSLASGPTCPCADIDGPPAPSGTTPGYGSGYGVVKSYARWSLGNTGNMTVTVTYGPSDTTPAITPLNKTPNRVRVVVQYPYSPIIFGGSSTSSIYWPTVTVWAAAEGRIMN